MPPHWLHAGPRSSPARRAGRTGGVSVNAAVGGFAAAGAGGAAAPGAPGAGPWVPPLPLPPLPVGGPGGGGAVAAAVAVAAVAVRGTGGVRAERGGGRLGGLPRADLLGEDPELLLRVDVEEARRQPAHDVVGHRLGERDLRVGGDPLRVEAHVAELLDERLERHAVLQRDRDRRRERVHHAAEGRALLADVGQEDLADRAVLVHAGGDVALMPADRELVRDRLALARHALARRADRGLGRGDRLGDA